MLTDDQRKFLRKGFKNGFHDHILADQLNIIQYHVSHYRNSLNISVKDVSENRLDKWIDLILLGNNLDSIAHLYFVKSSSIRQILWRERRFSFLKAKDAIKINVNSRSIRSLTRTQKILFGVEQAPSIHMK